MNEVKKRHDEFLREHSRKMEKLREPLHKAVQHMGSKSKALIKLKQPRMLTPEESAERRKNWPRATGHEVSQEAQMHRNKENVEHQRRTGRAWND